LKSGFEHLAGNGRGGCPAGAVLHEQHAHDDPRWSAGANAANQASVLLASSCSDPQLSELDSQRWFLRA